MKLFITGGAGFIGVNSAHYFLSQGHDVTIYDNMSRKGAARNLDWLAENHGERFTVYQADVRDYDALCDTIRGSDLVLHLAGQVAVTTSVADPRADFEQNALGTFNVLEAVRLHAPDAAMIYASTNKVYGGMEDVDVVEEESRYRYADFPHGIPETYPLDFHSPYGCSKGSGDQYTLDYARIYGLKTMVFRQSCIYGPRQFGVEDQGWAAHFIIAAVLGKPITIFGNGKQVRDMLHVSDLVRAYELGAAQSEALAGEVFNIGGGPENIFSIWVEFGDLLEEMTGSEVPVQYSEWRPGDQPVFVADIRKAEKLLGWQPQIKAVDGLRDLYEWVASNPHLFKE